MWAWAKEKIPSIDAFVPSSSKRDEVARHIVKELCNWKCKKEDIVVKSITDSGVTNSILRVSCKDCEPVLVRIYGTHMWWLYPNRAVENSITIELARNGLAPKILGQFINGRLEQWLPMVPICPLTMAGKKEIEGMDVVESIAYELAKLHKFEMPGYRKKPVLWDRIDLLITKECSRLGKDKKSKEFHEVFDLARLAKEVKWLKSILPPIAGQIPGADQIWNEASKFLNAVVFGHNDLLSGNILHGDGKLQLIDFEYAGYNFRGSDLANHFCEYSGNIGPTVFYDQSWPDDKTQARFLKSYIKASDLKLYEKLVCEDQLGTFINHCIRQIQYWALTAHMFVGLDAIARAFNAVGDYDWYGYARMRFRGYYYQKGYFMPFRETTKSS